MPEKITVVGSINMDLVTSTDRMPEQGETILGENFAVIPGGKGANQAVAAAKLGAYVHFIGRVGSDVFGGRLITHMKEQGVSTDDLEQVSDEPSGTASIILAEQDNRIIVVPGANNTVTPEVVAAREDVIAESDIMLLQLEIPLESAVKAAELAAAHDTTVILNPAPMQDLPKALLDNVDYFTPNEHELLPLFQNEPDASIYHSRCVMTKGADGVLFTEDNKERHIPGYPVEPVDTTGAGDTFNGALAAALTRNVPLPEACRFANAAAALSVQKMGAQGGMPMQHEVENFLKNKQDRS
ncbi:ribokinase [Salibacterium halotolerans]|uniref:Ribokinase n=1 Tax=Salibacterium halotolerans TaxID=1884432 RepID=A0A1I5WX33_9BACI|nr:ribokinase [Salibacterium halotolerans]SFQ24086.1 ribokinase [Salibacterium halotolerans]